MRNLYNIILAFIVLSVIPAWGQDSLYVQINVVSKKYNEAIQNVNVTYTIGEDMGYLKTNFVGQCRIRIDRLSSIRLQLSHPQFVSLTDERTISKRVEDTLRLEYQMEAIKMQDLNEIVVAAPGVPQIVYRSKRLHVEDFEIQKNGDLLLLTYPKRLKKGSELHLFDGQRTLNSFQVPGNAEELVRDYKGNTHVVCKENVFTILPEGEKIGIATVPKGYFLEYIAPIIDTNQSKLYFTTFNPDYPAFEYFSFDQSDSAYRKIMNIEDELMMELYRAEYKWADVRTKLWAKNRELQTGVDAEIWVGANYFTQSIYYKELYAPLFHRNDSLFVFDYYKDKLYTFDVNGNPIDSVAIYHHYNKRRTGWRSKLIQDKITGQIYALYDRAGYTYMGLIDTKSGEITEQVKLEYRYVEKVAVHDNMVYYVYRPFESIQKKYLYREGLPYSFENAKTPDGDVGKI